MEHIPVLLSAVLEFAVIADNGVVFDATLGAGGHCKNILTSVKNRNVVYYGMDKDRKMLQISRKNLAAFDHIVFIHNDHDNIGDEIEKNNLTGRIDFCLFDLGVSSVHLDNADRGFSFRFDSPLDMRLNQDRELTAAHILNTYSETKLADIFYKFGEERFSRRIARRIADYRETKKIENTLELADLVLKAYPAGARNNKRCGNIHPATRVFQALRIEVNGELLHLAQSLKTAGNALKCGGRLAVISFHSLEDRIVKNTFRALAAGNDNAAEFEILTKKPVCADENEVFENPRSRSAKMRVIQRCKR